MPIKGFIFRFLISGVRAVFRVFSFLGKKLRLLSRVASFVAEGLYKFLIFPGYKLFYWAKSKVFNVYSPAKSKAFYILGKSYVIHALLIILGISVTLSNVTAQDLRSDNFGDKTFIFSIVSTEDYEELTEESGMSSGPTKILGYLEQISIGNFDQGNDDNNQQLLPEFSMITEGGSALIKPNIMKPIDALVVTGPRDRAGIIKHEVQSGESVYSIALYYGISVDTVLWENNLTARSVIKPGMNLSILPVNGVAHLVKKGETLGAIAKKYSVDVDKIIANNNLFDKTDIQIGQKLIVPGGKKIIVATPTYVAKTPSSSSIAKLFTPTAEQLAQAGMLWPSTAKRISQYFSWRHTGLDIAGPVGTPLIAADAGTAVAAGWNKSGYGNMVLIDHGNGFKTRYAHASKLYVSVGDIVTKGQTIAAMGSTGRSTGSHLHFEVYDAGVRKNPLAYIK
jgi:LysM repeat protein